MEDWGFKILKEPAVTCIEQEFKLLYLISLIWEKYSTVIHKEIAY